MKILCCTWFLILKAECGLGVGALCYNWYYRLNQNCKAVMYSLTFGWAWAVTKTISKLWKYRNPSSKIPNLCSLVCYNYCVPSVFTPPISSDSWFKHITLYCTDSLTSEAWEVLIVAIVEYMLVLRSKERIPQVARQSKQDYVYWLI